MSINSWMDKENAVKWKVHFSRSVVSDSLRPHRLQHARLPCPSPTPGAYSCPLSWWCHPTISSSSHPLLLLPSVFPSVRVFSNESVLIRWPEYWRFSFSISPFNEYSGLISFRMDWLDLLAVQGPLKSLLQHHSSKASILWHSAFFIVQLSHPYMTTGKAIALTRRTFVGKVVSLLFNMLSSGVLFSHRREQNNAICSTMDTTGDYHTKWSKSQRERQILSDITYMWSLKYETNEPIYETGTVDVENRLVVAKAGGLKQGWSGRLGLAEVNFYI